MSVYQVNKLLYLTDSDPAFRKRISEEPETVLGAPYRSTVHQMDAAPHDDPERWALTWRAYLRKSGRRSGERPSDSALRPSAGRS